MLFSFEYIFFHELAFTGKWNIHPWDGDCYSEELKNSIIQTGIVHPPFLLRHPDKKLEVVSGHKRLLIANKYLESDKIGCFIIPEKLPPEAILGLLLTDQSKIPLSLAEKARFVEIASEYITKEEIVKNFSAKLEIREQTSAINEMLDLLGLGGNVPIYETIAVQGVGVKRAFQAIAREVILKRMYK